MRPSPHARPRTVPSPPGAALSPDGTYVATWSDKDDLGVKLWRMPPGAAKIADLTPRPGWKDWKALEFPVAIAPGGARVLTGATPSGSCYYGPEFSTEVHDVAIGRVVDTLPPALTATDGALRTVAFGAQLWCAR